MTVRKFETLVFRSFLKKGVTFVHLKSPANLFKDIEILEISVPGLARKLAPSFRNLPRSLLMAAAFKVSTSLKILST